MTIHFIYFQPLANIAQLLFCIGINCKHIGNNFGTIHPILGMYKYAKKMIYCPFSLTAHDKEDWNNIDVLIIYFYSWLTE